MKIAVNGRHVLNHLEGIGHYTVEVVGRLAGEYPKDEFHILYDRKDHGTQLKAPNIIEHVVFPPARHPLLWSIWFNSRIPQIMSRIEADVFFSPEGMLSLTSEVPTLMTIHDLAYIHFPEYSIGSHRKFLENNMPKFIKKADKISCVSQFTKNDVQALFPAVENKLSIAYNGVRNLFDPVTEESKFQIREKVTEGKKYVIYVGSIHPRKNIAKLIHAFLRMNASIDKPMMLVLAGRMAWKSDEIKKTLNQKEVMEHVLHLEGLNDKEVSQLIAGAEALCYISLWEGFGVPVLEAMASGVPVVTSGESAMEEICAHAAYYCDPYNVDSIQEALLSIVGDQETRKKYIVEGFKRASLFNWDETADSIYRLLTEMTCK